jgi:hypothetical protein
MIRVQFRANHNVSSSQETKYMSLFRGGLQGGRPLSAEKPPLNSLIH